MALSIQRPPDVAILSMLGHLLLASCCLHSSLLTSGAHSSRSCRDVFDIEKLKEAMIGQDVVYANLAGDLERMAKTIVEAMDATGVKRLIFISSMGIYNEVPGEKYKSILDAYRKSAEIIEASDLDYTILRPAWFTHKDEIDYESTQKGEPFKGAIVSCKSVADLVVKLAESPHWEVRRSLGVNKPNTKGD